MPKQERTDPHRPGAMRVLALDNQACKRCLASLAKRDREFRAKSRRWFRRAPRRELAEAIREGRVMLMPKRSRYCVSEMCDAARAIAREEGRAL